LRMVWEAHQAVALPLIGVGGIASGRDVVEFMLAGASAVEIGTMNFWDPKATENVLKELKKFCGQHGVEAVRSLTGALAVDEPAGEQA
ncbi:MAG: dihydroorotate dehydrogenase, partial [Terriglobales bacterium]